MKAAECTKHDGDSMDLEDCPDCIAWMEGERECWIRYLGGRDVIRRALAEERFYREDGTDSIEAARKLK